MANTETVRKTLGVQMLDLLRRKPKNFDVTFSVGPDKIKVEAVKFVLKAASPVFEREFEENWENGVGTEDTGIPLPNVDPTSFQLFVNLLILDEWSLDFIKALNLSPNNLLNLLGLCRRYEITKAIVNLEEAAEAFLQSFDKYKDSAEFLEISRENLETIFFSENIPLDETQIFECASRWASNQCTIKGLDATGENYREVVGAALFEIRFPTMSVEEFTKVGLFKKNILKAKEKLAVYEYIGLDIDQKKNWNKSLFPFKTNRRVPIKLSSTNIKKAPPPITTDVVLVNTISSSGCSVLSLPQQFKLTTIPSFACNGSQHSRTFQVSENILLLGFGFLGPIDGDTNFEVTVEIKRVFVVEDDFPDSFHIKTFKKNSFARQGKIFYFILNEPIAVESTSDDGSCGIFYNIIFSLKGPNNISQYKRDHPKYEMLPLEASGVQFFLHSRWRDGNPLAEVLFKKICKWIWAILVLHRRNAFNSQITVNSSAK